MKAFFLCCLPVFFFSRINAQISLTATAGISTGNYSTLKATFDAINSGQHKGVIYIIINGSVVEPTTAILNPSGGAAAYTSVYITPSTTCTISGNVATILLFLNGADNVIIDGRIGGVGSIRSLTIESTNVALSLGNGATNNTIRYTNIKGGSFNGPVLEIGSSNNIAGNSNNSIDHNDIGPVGPVWPSNGIYCSSITSSLKNRQNTISNNDIHDFYSALQRSSGIYLSGNNDNYTISGNSIFQTGLITGTPRFIQSFISIDDGGGHTIKNNFLGGSAPNCGGSPALYSGNNYIVGINLNSYSPNLPGSHIDGNVITNFNINCLSSGTLGFQGIYVQNNNTEIGTVEGNLIGSLTQNGTITVTYQTNSPFNYSGGMRGIVCVGNTVGFQNKIKNNQIGGFLLDGTPTDSTFLTGIFILGVKSVEIENNIIGGAASGELKNTSLSGFVRGIDLAPPNFNAFYSTKQNTVRNLHCTSSADGGVNGILTLLNPQSGGLVQNDIVNNQIADLFSTNTANNQGSVRGIFISTYFSPNNSFINSTIRNNDISNLSSASTGSRAMVVGIGNDCPFNAYLNIDSNVIHDLTGNSSNGIGSVQGIGSSAPYSAAISIKNNLIHTLQNTSTSPVVITGVFVRHGTDLFTASIIKNKIYELQAPNAVDASFSGILMNGRGTGKYLVANNMIYLNTSTGMVYGLRNDSTAGKIEAFHNSVVISGSVPGSQRSAALYRAASATTSFDVKDNIFYNLRSGGAGNHHAFINENASPFLGWASSNYNDFYSTDPAKLVQWGGNQLGLVTYRSVSSQDACSKSVPVDFANMATGDLHLPASSPNQTLWGISLPSINEDYDGDPRNPIPAMGADEITIVLPTVAISPVGPFTVCQGSSAQLTSSVTSGNQWYLNGSPVAGATGQTFNAAQSGTYKVITQGCFPATSNSIAVTVLSSPSPPVLSAGGPLVFCEGSNVVLISSVSSGNQWYKDNVAIAGATSQTLSVIQSGTYTVSVTNGNCVSALSNNIVVTVNPTPPQPTVSWNGSFLNSSAVAGNQWYYNGTAVAGASMQPFTPVLSGQYTVQVTLNGCQSVLSIPFAYTAPCRLSLNAVPVFVSCNGFADGSIALAVSGGVPPYTYQWSNGASTKDVFGLSVGSYDVLVEDAVGCKDSVTGIVISEPSALSASITSGAIPCFENTAFVTVTATGGTGALKYSLNGGVYQASSSFTVGAGTYRISIKDANGCTGKDTTLIVRKQCAGGLFVPTAFTPNGDGKNDIFQPQLFGTVKSYQFRVYNRWGGLVFQTSNLNEGWDGKTGGVLQTTGVYVWTVVYQVEGDDRRSEKGTVVMVR